MSKKRRNVRPTVRQNNITPTKSLPIAASAGILNPMPFGLSTIDGFSNPLARLGSGTNNLLEATQYLSSKTTKNFQLMNTLYRENWVVKRLIDVVPEDMIKNWYRIESQLPPDALRRFSKLERTTKVRAKILEGLKWSRLYGGAAAVIVIDGHDEILDKPLELDEIMPGSFKGLIILDRWSGISASSSIVKNISDPDFGLPEYYMISSDTLGNGIHIHHSRILRFVGRDLPYIERIGEQFWGASELEHIFEELKKRDNTSWNIATLIFSANLKVYKMENMDQLGVMNEHAQRDLYNTLSALNIMMNSQGMQVIGKDDSFETHQYSFAGLSDIYELFMLDVAGAAEIPVTKLFGRSPAGMNATGESDMQNYYDSIEEKQESSLRPIIDKLLPIMCVSEFGAIPDDLDYKFISCRRPTEEEKKTLAGQVATAVTAVFNAGIISQKIALKELRESSEMTGMWNNITDEDIDNADGSFGMAGENIPPGMMGGMTENTGDENFDLSSDTKDFASDGGPGSGRKPEGGNQLKLPDGFTGKESDMEIYKKLDNNVIKEYNKTILNTKARNGITIKEITGHAYAQAARRGVSDVDIKDTLLNGEVKALKDNGTQYIQNEHFKINVNAKNNKIVTVVNRNLNY